MSRAARRCSMKSGLAAISADDLDDAARKIVAVVKEVA